MHHKQFKSWSRKAYPAHERRRVDWLFSPRATEEERQSYIAEQTAAVRAEWEPWELHKRIVQHVNDVEVFVWKKS